MSGLEVIIVVGGAIYIAKKAKERKERKRLETEAAAQLESRHARATETTTTPNRSGPTNGLTQQVPVGEDESLPLYKAPTGPPPSNTTDMRWSESIHLPTYDELPESQSGKEFTVDEEKRQARNTQASSPSSLASQLSPAPAQTSYLGPPPANGSSSDTNDKKRKFWRRLSSSKTSAA